jgi:hypothetical protein
MRARVFVAATAVALVASASAQWTQVGIATEPTEHFFGRSPATGS